MNKIRQLIIGSMVMLSFVSAPIAALAETNAHANITAKAKANLIAVNSNPPIKQNTMPVISGITAPTVLSAGQEGTWTVNAFDPQNGPLTYSVDWGDNPMSSMRLLAPTEVFVQTSTFTHAYANEGTYKITFTVSNSLGQKTTSTVTVHITKAKPGAPVISNVTATSTKPKQGTVSWTTDVNSDSSVWFSTTSPVNTSGKPNVSRPNKVKNHKINLNGLKPDTTYYVVVGSKDPAGMSTSTEVWFKTPAEVNKHAPVISSLMGSTTIAAGDTEEVTVEAFDPENGSLSYSVDWGDGPTLLRMALLGTPQEIFTQTSTFTHVYENPGTYTAKFTVKDDTGLTATASLVITVTEPAPDVTPPKISDTPSDITIMATSTEGVVVNYTEPTATDDVDGDVEVTCSPASGSLFAVGSTTVTCSATDSSSNEATTTFDVIVTPRTTAPVISSIAELIGASTTTVSWITDEPTNSKIYYSLTSPVDITSSSTPFVFDSSFETFHSLSLSGLATSTPYKFVIESKDASNNTATSSEMTFTTTSGM